MSTFNTSDLDPSKYSVLSSSELPFGGVGLGQPKAIPIYYSDINSGYKLDGLGLIVRDDSAISRQLTNILSTPIGSDDFEPEFGSLLPWRIFEPVTPRMAWIIRNDSIHAIRRWMGNRIDLDVSKSSVTVMHEGDSTVDGYSISFMYTHKLTRIVAQYSVALVK